MVAAISEPGFQANATIPVALRVEVREKGSGLETRVCKLGGNFSENLNVAVYDEYHSSVGLYHSNAGAMDLPCTDWHDIYNTELSGSQIDIAWEIFSPGSAAWTWSARGWPNFPLPLDCKKEGANPTGTCWFGNGLAMTRTCLP